MSQDPLTIIGSSARLAALRQLELLVTPARPAFDRLTHLAARVLHAPVALVSFVEEERQFFGGAIGLAEPWATRRETPRSHTFCQYVVESGEPLIVADARKHPLLHDNPAISEMDVVAYVGMPLITSDGHRLGSFCVIDHEPRTWTQAEIDILRDLAASVLTEIELLANTIERTQAESAAQRLAEQRKRLLEVAQTVVSLLALDHILPQLQHTLQLVVAHDALSIYWLDAAAGLLRPAHQVAPAWLSDQAGNWPIPIDSGLAGAVVRSGRAEVVNNAQRDPRSIFPPGTINPPEHHQISIPLQVRDQICGVFLMNRTNSEPFTEQEFELAQIFMSFASLAIENARLFEQTKLAEERQRLLLEQVPCLLWTTDHDLRFTSSVGITTREIDLQPDSLIGRSIHELFEIDDPQAPPISAHRRALAGEPSTYDMDWHGHVFQTHVQPFRDAQGQVAGCIGVALDITERKQVEAALCESEDRYRTFFEHSIDAILLTAPDGRIFAANPAACRIFGRSEEDICRVGRAGVIDMTDARLPAALEQRARTGMFKGELTFLRKDGTLFPGELSTALFRDRNGLVKTSMIIRDITDRKRAEYEREQLIEALQEALANIKTLSGMLPICASCKKIRDDSGYWSQIEAYVQAHSDAVFSHGICPDCTRQLYGDFFEE
jgi:PAS domain S-box-containing protein